MVGHPCGLASRQDGIYQRDMPGTHALLGIMGKAAKMNSYISFLFFEAEDAASKTCNSKGYSLTELLIGLGLSSLVVAIALSLYQLCRQSWQAISATDALYQNAQVAIRAIRRQADLDGAAYLLSASDNHVMLSTPYPSVSNPSEGLVLSHWSGADPFDCQGNSSASPSALISNSFKRSSNKELTCKDINTSGSSYQALTEGVEDLQTRFAQINPVLNTLQWVNASALFGSAQIVAIEVCLRLATTIRIGVAVKGTLAPTTGCNGETIAADGKLRRVFRQVMALRNRLGAYG
jgi:type II secretory pathway pseudopilin PulG